MKCPQCGYQNKEDAAACNLCQSVLRKTVKKATTVEIKAKLPDPPASGKRHTLEAVGSAPILLAPGVELTIGRQAGTHLTIPSTRVSRVHAIIHWENGHPILSDKGSSNGTFVKGKQIKDHPLQDGDEIEIGPYLCVYRHKDPNAESAGSDLGDHTQTLSALELFSGSISENGIVEVLQGLEFNKKTGTLDAFGKEGEGWVVLERGVCVAASSGGKTGEEAIFVLLALKSGRFTFTGEIATKDRHMQKPVTALLLEWGRRADETERLAGGDDRETQTFEKTRDD